MLKPGDCLRVQTKTQDDVFGTVIYRVEEVGLPPPERERREAGAMDGVKCTMMGGSGPAARPGLTIMDSTKAISRNVKAGITDIISAEEAERCVAQLSKSGGGVDGRGQSSTGVVEVDY